MAIFRDDIPVAGAASSPDHLRTVLQNAGLPTAFLNSAQLANPSDLNYGRFDVLVLPYGASFPVNAADNFRKFLRAGGKFFSTGGYAFDNLLEQTTNGWRPYVPPMPSKLDGTAWFYQVPAAELGGRGKLTFRGFLKTENVAGPGFAHFSVYQIAADGSLPTWRDLCQVRGSQDWKEYRFEFDVDPRAATISLRAGLYRCRGTAWFDDVRLTDAAGNVLLEATFDDTLEPDSQAPRHWWRSHKELCRWQSTTTHSAQGALEARLGFEVPRVERLNTRHGRPEDGLEVEPTQLGVFQADYPLERASSVSAAPLQAIINPGTRLEGGVEGWAACGVVGWDTARWVPLLNAHDRYGRLRGAAGAMLRHYSGLWAGSSWAFFGVTNRDLFALGQPVLSEAFVSVVRSLARDIYFTALTTDRGCYRRGEPVKFFLPVFNGGRTSREMRVDLAIHAGEPGSLEDRTPRPSGPTLTHFSFVAQCPPRGSNVVAGVWQPSRFEADFYYLLARLWDGTNEIDRIDGGFIVQDSRVLNSGPKLTYRDNYLRFGKRPLFLFGTDDWGYVFNTTRETPLQWLRDMRQRRDLGVLLYENLQSGLPQTPAQQEEFLRKVDGVVQLAQKYGQVYFPGLLVGYNAAAGESDLTVQAHYCREFARRYANVPGLIYYLNGDYRCELSGAVTPAWNQFLRERYGSDARLREAWGPFAPSRPLGEIPAEEYHDWEQTWGDVSAYDRNCFRTWLMRRWNSSLISAIRECDPSHPTSGEFYQLPHSGVDLPAGIDGLDLANFGFFERPGDDLAKFPALCLYNDQRARGKSGGPGEYGVKTHPAWGDGKDYGYHTARTRAQAIDLFLAIPHYALGLGASRIHNWCWKDDAHRVFPWGMVYPCDGVPKDTALAHRNVSLLFRHFSPNYEPSQVYVLTPDSHRLGGGKWKVIDGILASLELILGTHVANPGTLNEQGLSIPPAAKVIFYPLPFCPSDGTCARLLEWVKHGGVLYLSGDISYDESRRRTRTARLEELCGVRFIAEHYPNIALNARDPADQPCMRVEALGPAEVLRRLPDGEPLLVRHSVGRGQVFFTPDPIELHSTPARRPQDLALYRQVLDAAGIAPLEVSPDDPRLHVMRVPLAEGGKVWVLFNAEPAGPAREVTIVHERRPVTVTVAPHRPALLWFNKTGALRGVETQGACSVGGERIWIDETGGIALTLDGRDLRRSRALLLMPLQAGRMQWRFQVNWAEPVLEIGEFNNGCWHTLDSQKPGKNGDWMQTEVSKDQALCLLLVCEKSRVAHWREYLGRAMTNPESLP